MKSSKSLLLAASIGLAGGVAIGAGIARFSSPAPPAEADRNDIGVSIGEPRPAFRHAGTDGRVWQASNFDGRWLLLNFWATWCAPCVREMPLLGRVDEDYGEALAVVGIAIDEPGRVPAFAERLGVTYPVLVGTSDVRETRNRYGNPEGLLPYTVLVDDAGIVRWRHLGELERAEIDEALARAGLTEPLRQPPR